MKDVDFTIEFRIRQNDLKAEIPMISTTKGITLRRTWWKDMHEGQELDEFFDDIKEEVISRIINK